MTTAMMKARGFCPMGCGQTLIKHPLRERLGDPGICTCHTWIARIAYPGFKPAGTYRVVRDSDGWQFQGD